MPSHLLDPATTAVQVPEPPPPSPETVEGLQAEEAAARTVYQNALAAAAALPDRAVKDAAVRVADDAWLDAWRDIQARRRALQL